MSVIKKGKIKINLIWSDSLGAKSFCFFIKTPDIKLLVDPGAAIMQPGYPLSSYKKKKLKIEAIKKISELAEKSEYIFISHYHYDHHIRPSKLPKNIKNFYLNKTIFMKDPNKFINYSQYKRARIFLKELIKDLKFKEPEEVQTKFIEKGLKMAFNKDYGDYNERKEELLTKGKNWLLKMKKFWETNKWVKETEKRNLKIIFADGKKIKIGKTEICFTNPLFHGVEYDRIGWVIGLTLKYENFKLIYTSDIQGPQIEDYAQWIIRENPDILFLDGFPIYLLGYITNRINFERAKENLLKILKETKANPVIFDHHHLRNEKFLTYYEEIYENFPNRVFTFAEIMGKKPLIIELKS